jgi:hypothetical protein
LTSIAAAVEILEMYGIDEDRVRPEVASQRDYEMVVLADTLLKEAGRDSLRNTVIAFTYGTSEASVRRRRASVRKKWPEAFERARADADRAIREAREAREAEARAYSEYIGYPAPGAGGDGAVDAAAGGPCGGAEEGASGPVGHDDGAGGFATGAPVLRGRAEPLHESAREQLEDVDEFFGIPSAAITSRGRSIRLEDGSWEKIGYDPKKVALLQALTYNDIEKLISEYEPPERDLGAERIERTLVACLADFQTGKTDLHGGTKELSERAIDILNQWDEELGHYDTIIMADLGDIVEGFGNTESQAQSNDLSMTDQYRVAVRLMYEGLRVLSEHCDTLVYVAVPSNHATFRNGVGAKRKSVNRTDNDWGLVVQEHIMSQVQVHQQYGKFMHVRFVRPADYEVSATVIAPDGTGAGFTHGDQSPSQDRMGQWWAQQGRVAGLDKAHVLFHGHHHNFRITQAGQCAWVICAPSLDNGSSWFTNRSGSISNTGMITVEIGGGRWYNPVLWEPRVGFEDAEGAKPSGLYMLTGKEPSGGAHRGLLNVRDSGVSKLASGSTLHEVTDPVDDLMDRL